MNKNDQLIAAFDARAKRRDERRHFIKLSGGVAAATMLSGCFGDDDDTIFGPTPAPTPAPASPAPTPAPSGITDGDVLNFALNLEYLEANFYLLAVTGAGLPASLTTGTGTRGDVTGGRQVNFSDPAVAQYAREIAIDERAHVEFLRQAIGSTAVAQPQQDLGTGPNSAFSNAARAAGLIGAGASFDPYANDENFLLGAFIFEDVGVTAYKGASPLIKSAAFLEAAAGILAAEAYHAGLVRTVLYGKGVQTPALRTATDRISDARDSLDGPSDLDQGVSMRDNASNIVPADQNAIAFSRTTGQVLNIVYLNGGKVTQGGFFPNGVNGAIRTSG